MLMLADHAQVFAKIARGYRSNCRELVERDLAIATAYLVDVQNAHQTVSMLCVAKIDLTFRPCKLFWQVYTLELWRTS